MRPRVRFFLSISEVIFRSRMRGLSPVTVISVPSRRSFSAIASRALKILDRTVPMGQSITSAISS